MGSSAQGKINIIIKGEDKTGGVFKKTFGKINNLAKGAALAGGVAVAAAGVGMIAVAAKGVGAFIEFEDQMNEVFTLLPGISGAAMKEMRDQVQEAAIDMGRLPNEVIPALYQSLSAGVPPDNVFEFMETAHQAALGGVTDLETAVDGITSVVNAYGSDVITATEASDQMFTAVRLGKTDFQKLSKSLFNVIPTAAALGVSFGDVSAVLATLTGQGTPTSVATTQIRAALVEASKGGTKLDKAIQDLTGSTFPELIDQGESMPGIFETLRNSMPEQQFKDLFGSVEAVNAVLGITGPNFDKTVAAMEEMNSSAGATETAYDTMNQGFARTIEVIKTRLVVGLQKLGEALLPIVKIVGEKLVGALEIMSPILDVVISAFGTLIKDIENGADPLDTLQSFLVRIVSSLGLSEDKFETFGDTINNVFLFIKTAITTIDEFIVKLREFLTPIVEAVAQFVSWKDVLIVFATIIGGVVLSAIISIATSLAPILLIIGAAVLAVAILRSAWENDWGGIRTFIIETWENTIKPALTQLGEFLSINLPVAIEVLRQFWENTLQPLFTKLVDIYISALKLELAALSLIWTNVLLPAINSVWLWLSTTFIPFIQDVLIPWLEENIPRAIQILSDFWTDTLLPAITNIWTFIQDDLVPLLTALAELVEVTLSVAVEILAAFWENVLLPAITAVSEWFKEEVIPILIEFWEFIKDKLTPILEPLVKWFDNTSDSIGGLSGAVKSVIGWISSLIDWISKLPASLPSWLQRGSPTPFELSILGIDSALKSLTIGSLPKFANQMNNLSSTGFNPNIGNQQSVQSIDSSSRINYFNLSLTTTESEESIIDNFQFMKAIAN